MEYQNIFEDNTPLEVQIQALANFIMAHYPQYIRGDGAIGTALAILQNTLESSNGRTDDSESSNVGSNPALRAKQGCQRSHYTLYDYEHCSYCGKKGE